MISLYAAMLLTLASYADDVMTKQADGTYVVNTTTLCQARGYKSTTPVEVYIKSGKVVKVVPLKNTETPGYFKKATRGLLSLFEGLKIILTVSPILIFNIDIRHLPIILPEPMKQSS